MELTSLVSQLVVLAGFGALVAALINIGKTAGVVKEGQAPIYSVGLNLVGLVVLYILKVFAPQVSIEGLDSTLAQVAQLLTIAFGLFVQLGGAKLGHELLSGTPIVGTQFTK